MTATSTYLGSSNGLAKELVLLRRYWIAPGCLRRLFLVLVVCQTFWFLAGSLWPVYCGLSPDFSTEKMLVSRLRLVTQQAGRAVQIGMEPLRMSKPVSHQMRDYAAATAWWDASCDWYSTVALPENLEVGRQLA